MGQALVLNQAHLYAAVMMFLQSGQSGAPVSSPVSSGKLSPSYPQRVFLKLSSISQLELTVSKFSLILSKHYYFIALYY